MFSWFFFLGRVSHVFVKTTFHRTHSFVKITPNKLRHFNVICYDGNNVTNPGSSCAPRKVDWKRDNNIFPNRRLYYIVPVFAKNGKSEWKFATIFRQFETSITTGVPHCVRIVFTIHFGNTINRINHSDNGRTRPVYSITSVVFGHLVRRAFKSPLYSYISNTTLPYTT